MLTIIKIFTLLWPFIKEMAFGRKTVREAVQTNKLKTSILLVLIVSVLLNVFSFSKIVAISRQYIMLDKKYKAAEGAQKTLPSAKSTEPKLIPVPPASSDTPSVERTVSNKPRIVVDVKKQEAIERYNRLKANLDAIKKRQEQEQHDDR
jgi:hypothetical protein